VQKFQFESSYRPTCYQTAAIEAMVRNIKSQQNEQALLSVTGKGKTFTMENVVQQIQRPTLVLRHNKTLAAQLYNEFKQFLPNNEVHYFVSNFDSYQPEASSNNVSTRYSVGIL